MARILVLSPHPDDEAIGCGGTICSHRAAGDSVRVVFLTSGELGGHGASPEVTRERREREAAVAARILDVEIECWREPDSKLRAGTAVVERLARMLREWHPDVVYTTHPGETHPDHRACARIVGVAIAALERPPQVFGYEIWTPVQKIDHIVDITQWIDRKIDAVRAYESQCSVLRFDEAVRGLNRYRGELFSWPEGDYAEVFVKLGR